MKLIFQTNDVIAFRRGDKIDLPDVIANALIRRGSAIEEGTTAQPKKIYKAKPSANVKPHKNIDANKKESDKPKGDK